jgi:lysozyme
MPRAVPEAAVDLIRRAEGFHRLLPDGRVGTYLCPANVWTVGWGQTTDAEGRPLTATSGPFTREECEALFGRDLARFAAGVGRLLRVPVTGNQFGALVSLAYNLGLRRLQASTLLRHVNAGRWDLAADEFPRWVMAGGRRLPGLVLRRAAERALFLAPDPQPEMPAAPVAAPATSGTVSRFMAAFDRARAGAA